MTAAADSYSTPGTFCTGGTNVHFLSDQVCLTWLIPRENGTDQAPAASLGDRAGDSLVLAEFNLQLGRIAKKRS